MIFYAEDKSTIRKNPEQARQTTAKYVIILAFSIISYNSSNPPNKNNMPPKRQNKKDVTSTKAALSDPFARLIKETGDNVTMDDLLREIEANLTDEERADELFYDAMGAETLKQKSAMIKKVLALDPEHTDANLWMLRNSGAGKNPLDELRRIVDAAARKLGAKVFKKGKGIFWGISETRPYMRAREQLASHLIDAGQMDEGIKECEEMLALNRGDNQGIRHTLLKCYLCTNRQEEARQLIKRFASEIKYNAVFAWGDVLLRRLSPNQDGLEKALKAARKQNTHIEAYITGKKKIPKILPPLYSIGSEEEAACFAKDLHAAWTANPEALEWLRAQSANTESNEKSKGKSE